MTLRVKNSVVGNERRFYLPCPKDGGVRGGVDEHMAEGTRCGRSGRLLWLDR